MNSQFLTDHWLKNEKNNPPCEPILNVKKQEDQPSQLEYTDQFKKGEWLKFHYKLADSIFLIYRIIFRINSQLKDFFLTNESLRLINLIEQQLINCKFLTSVTCENGRYKYWIFLCLRVRKNSALK